MTKKQNTISTKLRFEGEAEYKAKVAEINTSLYNLGQELKLTAAQFADNAKSTEALTAKQEVLQKQYITQGERIKEMTAALAALNAQENINETAVKKQKEALMDAKIAYEKTGSQIRMVEKELAEAGDESADFTKDLKNNADQAVETSDKFANMGKVLGTVGKAFGTAVAAIGTAALAAGTAVAGLAAKSLEATGDLDDAAQRVGMTAEAYQQWIYAAKLSGLESNTLESAMIKQQKAFADAKDGSTALAEAYNRLSIDITQVGSSADSFDLVVSALAEMEDKTTANAIANDIFGKSYAEITPLLNAGADGIAALKQEAVDLGSVMSNEVVAAGAAAGDAVDRLKTTLSGITNQIGTSFIPTITALAGELTPVFKEVATGLAEAGGDITKIGEVFGNTLSLLLNKLVEKLPDFINFGVDVIKAVIDGIAENAGNIATAAVAIVDTLVNALADTLPVLLQGAVTLIRGLAHGIAAQLPTLIPIVVEMLLTLFQGIAENIPIIIDSALMIIQGLVDGILNALPILIDMLPTLIITIVNGIIEGLPMIFSAAAGIITSLIDGLIACIPELIASIPYLIVAIVTGIVEGLPEIFTSAGEIITALVNGLISAIPQLVASIPQIIFAIVDAFASRAGNFFQIGVDIIKGLWEGIKSMFSTLWENVKNCFGNLVDGVKDFLGIHSPSTVFAGLGVNMADGIGEGFTDEMQKVTDQIKDAIPTEFDTKSEITFVAAPVATKTAEKQTIEELAEAEESGEKKQAGHVLQITQNIYTPQYNYAEQQRVAEQQLRQIARQV